MIYSGRTFTDDEIQWIRKRIQNDPDLKRTPLSREICEKFNWRKKGGGLKDMRCRVVLLEMEKDGLVKLPKSSVPRNQFDSSITFQSRSAPGIPMTGSIEQMTIRLELIQNKESSLWNEYIERYHYLGYKTLPGEQMRYFVRTNDQIIALLGFGASAWKVASRERFIGWTQEQKEKNLYLVVNNARFLILPWIKIKNAASRILSMVMKQLPEDWDKRYGYRPVLLETFVQKDRFQGTCYKAANWIYVGDTTGRGKWDRNNKANIPVKGVWVKPLCKDFQKKLCTTGEVLEKQS